MSKHGNSLDNPNPHHLYEIRDTNDDDVFKYGITDDPIGIDGMSKRWNIIKSFYGLERIKIEMLQERYFDKKTLSFLSCIFDMPKEKFRCYTGQQSSPPHWNF